MRDIAFAIMEGLLAGLLVYSLIGWGFTKRTASKRYVFIFFLSLILLGILIVLAKIKHVNF